jgi:RNA polymerase sigma factor (TIGR02999 family)
VGQTGGMSSASEGVGGGPDVTELLVAWEKGDDEAFERLARLVYGELRALAAAQMRGERRTHTLQPTALVHEAFLRLSGQRGRQWKERRQFFAVSASLMRQVLVDHARGRRAAKRGGEETRVEVASLDELPATPEVFDVLALDEVLTRLAALQPRLSKVVELRFFGGLEVEETAEVLGCSPRTVKRDWALARAWLVRELGA